MKKKYILNIIRNDYDEESDKNPKIENAKKFFDISKQEEYTLDDETWSDMDMDRVYKKLDRSYSSLGESVLYYMLRNPINDEEKLKNRSKAIESFKNNADLREKLLCIFFKLSTDAKNSFLDMIESDLVINRLKYYLYTLLGKVFPIISIIIIIFLGEKYAPLIFLSTSLNLIVNYIERNTIKSRGIVYLKDILKSAKKISSIKDNTIKEYIDTLTINLKEVKDIDKSILMIGFVNMWQGFFEIFSILFLVEECAYYKISMILKAQKDCLMNIYYILGELESLLSISGYQKNLKQPYVKPTFTKDVSLNIVEGIHPILENPVANSISMKNKGMVLTGTNMSGKSTFLRMLGVNILLAQTFYFTLAKDYKASFFNIVSSISPSDSLSNGKSYYMAEAEGILRIFNALKKDLPIFCPIDEIFRGTNPVERIAMSAEILSYLNSKKTISIVATHDRELVDILKDIYEFYYFSEDINNKDGLSFDYKLKVGVSQTRNAIRLLEYIGYPKEVTGKAYKRAETIKGFI